MSTRAAMDTILYTLFARAKAHGGMSDEELVGCFKAARYLAWMMEVHGDDPEVLAFRRALS